jgi:hypothetical protein
LLVLGHDPFAVPWIFVKLDANLAGPVEPVAQVSFENVVALIFKAFAFGDVCVNVDFFFFNNFQNFNVF